MLRAMYASFFGLRQTPFSIAPDPRYLYLSERHREALAHLLYGVQGGGGFVLLTGEIGAGKTTVCRAFLEQMPATCQVAYIFNPRLTVHELLQTVCEEFGVDTSAADASPAPGVKTPVDRLNAFLLQAHAAGKQAVLIIDEAQNLAPDVLEQLRLLTNLETSERKLLQIVLIGQPELRELLARPELEQLAQRVIARFHLGALTADETARYVQHRLQVAGLQGEGPFTAAALRRIHTLTGGVPRRINLLCDRALLGAYGNGLRQIGDEVIERAAREVTGDPAPAAAEPRSAARDRWWPLAWGLAGTALGAAGVLAFWQPWAQPAPARSEFAATSPDAGVLPAAPTAAAQVPQPVQTGLPATGEALPSEDAAWQALARQWGQDIPADNPCAAALQQQLQCYRTPRMTTHGLQALDRPAILTLRPAGQAAAWVLLVGASPDDVLLQAGERRWRVPAASLAAVWQGEYATLWRLPPGQTGRLVDGWRGPAAPWLEAQLDRLQQRGETAGDTPQARLQAFQTRRGIPADGLAGPVTLMQINRAAGVDEPRLGPA
ncbi:ATPase AAA [Hydrogenophaga electricum]|uniref:ATPase AAA n=2 Tax=Hydrogenophaga electricum TaxID=1230953 RepID=A0ABQ6C5K1_9BURK|nr:ATPase AAA [Hydrogenophaga electricum]